MNTARAAAGGPVLVGKTVTATAATAASAAPAVGASRHSWQARLRQPSAAEGTTRHGRATHHMSLAHTIEKRQQWES